MTYSLAQQLEFSNTWSEMGDKGMSGCSAGGAFGLQNYQRTRMVPKEGKEFLYTFHGFAPNNAVVVG